ncbi:TetR/AcrR family transcriptional regulator [Streptomyces sp. XM4193]|uniref:TetR/AcrR family transcriptional regulator n=1 Tax=Streptomyces sp. XM4193 TaxID=2929782 RepID=UPI001FF918DC|nr:TetR/AcrR family transcriptional regulator [Streptomyces sp. XM4193]MCK1797540.1 TetR/AcrR family transcriptional regulator [Streptomyces sp. XM4193]
MARPRNASTDLAILDATRAELVEKGWSKLSMASVAERAGVAKTTLYRRWPGRSEMVVDAVAVLFDELELPDRGSLQSDIEGVVLSFAALMSRPEAKTALMAVVAESTHNPRLRDRIRTTVVDRQKRLVRQGRLRAQERGELPVDGPDPAVDEQLVDLTFDVVAGAVVHRVLVSDEPVDEQWAAAFALLLVGGITAING